MSIASSVSAAIRATDGQTRIASNTISEGPGRQSLDAGSPCFGLKPNHTGGRTHIENAGTQLRLPTGRPFPSQARMPLRL